MKNYIGNHDPDNICNRQTHTQFVASCLKELGITGGTVKDRIARAIQLRPDQYSAPGQPEPKPREEPTVKNPIAKFAILASKMDRAAAPPAADPWFDSPPPVAELAPPVAQLAPPEAPVIARLTEELRIASAVIGKSKERAENAESDLKDAQRQLAKRQEEHEAELLAFEDDQRQLRAELEDAGRQHDDDLKKIAQLQQYNGAQKTVIAELRAELAVQKQLYEGQQKQLAEIAAAHPQAPVVDCRQYDQLAAALDQANERIVSLKAANAQLRAWQRADAPDHPTKQVPAETFITPTMERLARLPAPTDAPAVAKIAAELVETMKANDRKQRTTVKPTAAPRHSAPAVRQRWDARTRQWTAA